MPSGGRTPWVAPAPPWVGSVSAPWAPPSMAPDFVAGNGVWQTKATSAAACLISAPVGADTVGRLIVLQIETSDGFQPALSWDAAYDSWFGLPTGLPLTPPSPPEVISGVSLWFVRTPTGWSEIGRWGSPVPVAVDGGLLFSGQTDAAAAALGTLANAPTAGNPVWVRVTRNGVAGAMPWWPL